jgi:hypothetical protein
MSGVDETSKNQIESRQLSQVSPEMLIRVPAPIAEPSKTTLLIVVFFSRFGVSQDILG